MYALKALAILEANVLPMIFIKLKIFQNNGKDNIANSVSVAYLTF